MRDFTLDMYMRLCSEIKNSPYVPLTVEQYCNGETHKNFIILRHDVDRKPENALKMAKIENSLGIASTYYFRMRKSVFKPEIIREIAKLGHEIGYHYEVLDIAKGDFEKAIKIFKEDLKKMREVCAVKTICMHGNPLTPWLNRDLWTKYNFKDFNIIGEAYLSIDYQKTLYLTDTGRNWNSSFSLKDIVSSNVNRTIKKINGTDDVIKIINNQLAEQICISSHPERWSDSYHSWLKDLIWQNIKNVGKFYIKILRERVS